MARVTTAAERMTIGRALGREVLQTADTLQLELNQHGQAPAHLWRSFLQALYDGAGDTVMSSPLGMAVQAAIVGKIRGIGNGTTARVSAAVENAQVWASLETGAYSDSYIRAGRIGRVDLAAAGCYTWGEVLRLAAEELWRTGEAAAARVTVKAGRETVRELLRQRFGVVTGARLYWHPSHRTPDDQDAREFLSVLRNSLARQGITKI